MKYSNSRTFQNIRGSVRTVVATLNKLINIDGDAEEVCNFAHIETIYIRLHEKKNQNSEYLSTLPSRHPKKDKL